MANTFHTFFTLLNKFLWPSGDWPLMKSMFEADVRIGSQQPHISFCNNNCMSDLGRTQFVLTVIPDRCQVTYEAARWLIKLFFILLPGKHRD